MWTCPKCGRGFANRNQFHFCSTRSLDEHFVGRDPNVVATFQRLLAAAEKSGPVTVVPEKTRGEVDRWLAEAYSVGEQRHLGKRAHASGSDS